MKQVQTTIVKPLRKEFNQFFVIAIAILLTGCGSVYKCVPEADSQAMITWGVITAEGDNFDGYVMMANGEIFKENWHPDKIIESTGLSVDEELYCNFRNDLLALYKKTQATNQPADTTHYMEYLVPERNLRLRSRWNPKFDNVGNQEWKKMWDRLELFLESRNN